MDYRRTTIRAKKCGAELFKMVALGRQMTALSGARLDDAQVTVN